MISLNFAATGAQYAWNGLADNADAIGVITVGQYGAIVSRATSFNGTAWDRRRTQSASNVSAATQIGAALSAPPGNWSVANNPAANTRATITRAAGGAGVRHICTSIAGVFLTDAGAAPASVLLQLRDGASGAGTVLWEQRMSTAGLAVGQVISIALSGLQIFGTANTAMTLEFSAAGGAATFEGVALTGYSVA